MKQVCHNGGRKQEKKISPRQPHTDKLLHSFCNTRSPRPTGRLRTYLNNGTENVLFSPGGVYRFDIDLWLLLFRIYAMGGSMLCYPRVIDATYDLVSLHSTNPIFFISPLYNYSNITMDEFLVKQASFSIYNSPIASKT